MIINFADNETEKIFEGYLSKKLPREIQNIARRKLKMLHFSINLNDLKVPPSNRLEKLKGNSHNYYSIRINSQWRIVFIWENNNSYDVQIIDYH